MQRCAQNENDVAGVDGAKEAATAKTEQGGVEAVRVLPTGTTTVGEIDPEVEKRVRRKLDMHLIPLLSALYLLAFLDRSNIGNARIAGLARDLRLTRMQYNRQCNRFPKSQQC